jgi:hypothetical protein
VECSLLVADKVRRTVKFLCVLGQGKPIVSPEWLIQSWRCTSFIGIVVFVCMFLSHGMGNSYFQHQLTVQKVMFLTPEQKINRLRPL